MKSRLLILIPVGWFFVNLGWAADPPVSVPPKGGLPECQANLLICTGDLDSCDIALGTCVTDLTTCDTDLGTCTTDLTDTTAELATCTSELATCEASAQAFPATGQTSCWDSDGNLLNSCDGTGQDGDIRAGAELSYTETTYTVIDNNTQLEWMKQDDNNGDCASYPGSLEKSCMFTWNEAFTFVASLNANNHGGHTDWRVPNIKELHSIVNYENVFPAVSDAFNSGCVAGCTVDTCSCTDGAGYWTSTTFANNPESTWFVTFNVSGVLFTNKLDGIYRVRAVRGGL